MEEEEYSEPSPQLTGVVIITLPPRDNPSLGKTITAFTLSDHQISIPPHPPQVDPPQSAPPPPQVQEPSLASSQTFSSFRPFHHNHRITVLPILVVALIALYVCVSLSQENLFQLRDEVWNDDDPHKNKSQHAFLFPLYQKSYNRANSGFDDFELKLGRFRRSSPRPMSNGFDDTLSRGKISAKLRSTSSKIDATSVMPVGGNVYPDGLYYTYIHVGNPPRPYFLDMDTGSDLTWIQCDAPCTSCAKGAHPFYKPVRTNIIPSKDSYCAEIQRNQMIKGCDSCHQCDYEIEYADHSSSMGVLARDELYLKFSNGTFFKSKVVFGCAYDQQGLLLNTLGKTDGILGLSRAKISLPYQLASKGIIKNVVGHCLASDVSGGGYMLLGDDFVPYSQITWVPMFHSPDSHSYQTEILKVSYGNTQIGSRNTGVGNARGRVVFDSGSSYSYFTGEAYNDLVTIFADNPSESIVRDLSDTWLPICWRAISPLRSVKEVRQFFKPVTIQFQSKWWMPIKFQIPPEDYLVINSKGNVCLGILNGSKVHGGSVFILGDISLRGQLVVYDNVKERIGWVRSDCIMPRRSESHSLY